MSLFKIFLISFNARKHHEMPYDSFINNDDNNREHQTQQQNVQNERKISNHLVLNHLQPPRYDSEGNLPQHFRFRRDTNNLYDDENQLFTNYDDYGGQNDGKFSFFFLKQFILIAKKLN